MGSGSGSKLPAPILWLAGICSFVAVAVSAWSIYLQFKNYRKPSLQRMVVRIMVMVPVYAIASMVSIHSVEAAFVIDAIRDIYEAFVIYCFFELLLSYLGGERSLLIMLHGRPPKEPVFPMNLFKREIDVSDPYTFLFLKRGILQYVQVKPILAAVTLILKACGKYNEGDFRANSGYLYISIIYNASICTSLYCLAMFWVCVNDDLKPFRPVPKFLCVKGILFFSFWQSVAISTLVAANVIKRLGPYTDPEHVSTGLNNIFICVEMPFFAFAHMFAFSYRDYIDPHHTFVARMPVYYAFRDAFGLKDVVEDSKATLRGEGMDYREFEPAEGFMHQGEGRDRRIRAGLRYSKGGQRKYWLPRAVDHDPHTRGERILNKAVKKIAGDSEAESIHAPLLETQEEDVVHLAPDMMQDRDLSVWDTAQVEDGYELPFGDLDEADEELFEHSKRYLFGDYNYPCIDVSSEGARRMMWDEEERVLRDERGAWFSSIRGAKGQEEIRSRDRPVWQGYGAVDSSQPRSRMKEAWISNREDSEAVRPIRQSGTSRVIDFDSDRAAADSPYSKDGVHLRWTKGSQQPSSSKLPSRPAPKQRPDSSASSSSSGSGSKTRLLRSPPTLLSRSNSRQSNSTSPVLPPDAVDLVVEDPEAEEEDLSHERRKGEPAVRPPPGLKKVYRRGFETEELEGDGEKTKVRGEVEVEERTDHNRRRVVAGERIIDSIHRGGSVEEGRRPDVIGERDPYEDRGGSRSPWDDNQPPVVRAETPPLNARINAYHFDDIPGNDDNPWA
ncbi:DUF300 domain-containing protein [Coprinopsis cinerea okayama7|uniref:DUF300 domain-containing protein n=1 Tax=Coprinopsis cinerea (strain Okayama-7 / 130 / ATCC MYA-4618 / FGSC 9003) TaxID=240176 RepID=A8NNV4_COPC7|nr:DUF300 domain-containing protein [Coprinopsis cinerea okayama7\|eukprot:XP_001835205.2 DUF300 domain-containing protein [Coprinopsis cinerea okayama7\